MRIYTKFRHQIVVFLTENESKSSTPLYISGSLKQIRFLDFFGTLAPPLDPPMCSHMHHFPPEELISGWGKMGELHTFQK